jgi:hypothetical protein
MIDTGDTSSSCGSAYTSGTSGGRPKASSGILAVTVVPFTGIMQEAEL